MKNKGQAYIGILIFLVIGVLIGGFCWTYSINKIFALTHTPKTIEFWQGALIGLVPYIGHLGLPVAVVLWIVGLIIGV